jgi:hypothetical protein
MRFVTLTLTLSALAFGTYQLALAQGFEPTSSLVGPATPERLAIEIRCGALAGVDARDCAARLTARIAAGGIDAESVVRLHCTRIENVWIRRSAPEPPAVCTQRFGGWLTG